MLTPIVSENDLENIRDMLAMASSLLETGEAIDNQMAATRKAKPVAYNLRVTPETLGKLRFTTRQLQKRFGRE